MKGNVSMKSGIKICVIIAALVVLIGVVFTGCTVFGGFDFGTILPSESTEEIDGSDGDFSKLY